MIIKCSYCKYFIPDPIGDEGIGACQHLEEYKKLIAHKPKITRNMLIDSAEKKLDAFRSNRLLYPNILRNCQKYET